jgi:hypothetical protein
MVKTTRIQLEIIMGLGTEWMAKLQETIVEYR